MRLKIRYLLPLAQMALAALLLRAEYRWAEYARHIYDMPGPSVEYVLLFVINAPAFVARRLLFADGYYGSRSDFLLVPLIGLLWFWIAHCVERRGVVLFAWRPLRIATDAVLCAFGALFVALFPNSHMAGLPTAWRALGAIALLIWIFGPPLIFGLDLGRCLRHKSPNAAVVQ